MFGRLFPTNEDIAIMYNASLVSLLMVVFCTTAYSPSHAVSKSTTAIDKAMVTENKER